MASNQLTVQIRNIRVVTDPASDNEWLGFRLPTPERTVTMCEYDLIENGQIVQSGESGVEHANATEAEVIQQVLDDLAWSRREEAAEWYDETH